MSFEASIKKALEKFRHGGPVSYLSDSFARVATDEKRRPTVFFLPNLHASPFWDSVPAQFSEKIKSLRDKVQQAQGAITSEFLSLQASKILPDELSRRNPPDGWTQHTIIAEGKWNQRLARLCPKTTQLLRQLPLCNTSLGYAYFSTLAPNADIRAHYGASNIKLRMQVPLVVGEAGGAAITVSTSTRVYSKQDIIIFDDTFAHSVQNSGTSPRTVLLIDIWHPQLTLSTRQQLIGAFPPRGDDACRAPVHQLKQLPSSVLITILVYLPPASMGAAVAACSTFTKTLELPGLWRRRLAHVHLSPTTLAKVEGEDVARELRRLYVDAVTGLQWDVKPGDLSLKREKTRVKVLLTGACGAGKTSIQIRVGDNAFSDKFITTVGVDFRHVFCKLRDHLVRLEVWDMAGPERFLQITRTYYRGADVILCCFDLTCTDWAKDARGYLDNARRFAPNCLAILVGCKKDLESERVVRAEEARQLATAMGGVEYMECSSKTGEGVRQIMAYGVKEYVERFGTREAPPLESTGHVQGPMKRRKWCVVM